MTVSSSDQVRHGRVVVDASSGAGPGYCLVVNSATEHIEYFKKGACLMAEIYTYRAEVFVPVPSVDVTGFDVEATDGHIGKVDEATYESGSSYWSSTPASGSSARSG